MPPKLAASTCHRQIGVALITVLLIVFLASVTATGLATLQQLAIRRSTVLQHQQQARLYTLGLEQWAMVILARDRQDNEIDHPDEEWAKPLLLPVDGGELSGQITDLQSCFNLNNLWRAAPGGQRPEPNDHDRDRPTGEDMKQEAESRAATEDATAEPSPAIPQSPANPDPSQSGKEGLDQPQMQVLQRLLESLALKPELAQAIVDWIDPNLDPLFPDGAEDSDYMVLDPAYLAANRPFASVSELRLVKGVDRETYDKLAPYVRALPPGTALNVNTASAPVLAALSDDGVDEEELERLLETRPTAGYDDVDKFLNAAKLAVNAELKAHLSVGSQYFLLRAEARVGDGRAMLYSMLYRDKDGVRVLRHGFGNQD
ncbi:MAG: type II secretion system minor pseudopilin GspK [Candidatus Competibacter sp.]|nr:type II secretion system minor pseudopilin GspK [Candidatus Competibacter sp.]MDG4585341.1 type II secretion system minor pseudopilin GspK [Candidatus Competibacter sp.]